MVATALTLWGAASDAQASAPDSYGFGSRSAALAGAVAADAHDFSSAYYNPAGMAEAPGIELTIGYMNNWQNLRINDVDNDVAGVHGLVGGLVAPGEVFGMRIAFGVALHLPDDGLSYLKARRQGVPRWELYDARQQLLYLAANLAIAPFDWLSLGGGIGYLSATRGSFQIRGRADVISPFDSELQHEVDADLTAVRYPQAGARVRLEDWGALAVTYRGKSDLDLNLDARLEGIVDFAGIEVPLLYELEAATIAAFTPQQVVLGISFQRIQGLRANFDVTWVNWSQYESPTAKITAKLAADPPPGTPVDLPGSPAPTQVVPPDFRDRLVPRVGVEGLALALGAERQIHGARRHLFELLVRGGYAYEASPVPDQTGLTNLIDADRHTVTAGFGLSLNAPGEVLPGSLVLDLHGLLSLLPEREVRKDSPADFVGDYRAGGNIIGLGATMGVVF